MTNLKEQCIQITNLSNQYNKNLKKHLSIDLQEELAE